jgi:uroporphyrinogen-III decarboxylase
LIAQEPEMAYPGVVDDLRACIELRPPGRLPVFALGLELDMRVAGLSHEEQRTDVAKSVGGIINGVRRFNYDWGMVFPDDYIEFEPLGLKMHHPPDGPAMAAEYLPLTGETLRNFRVPDARREMRLPIHLEMIRRLKEALGDSVCIAGRIAAPFSAAALVYGIDRWLVAMLDEPDLVRDNIAFFVDHQIAFGRAQIEAGADLLWLGDCVAGSYFIGPRHYAEFAFEAAARVIEAMNRAGGLIIYHSAERSLPHLKHQAQLPRCAVNVGEGPSIAAIRQSLGVRKCLTGNFDPKFLRDAAPAQVAAATESMIRENLTGGDYIFNTGEGIMSTTPPGNVEAMMRAARAAVSEMTAPAVG